jgi:hypothetical protein
VAGCRLSDPDQVSVVKDQRLQTKPAPCIHLDATATGAVNQQVARHGEQPRRRDIGQRPGHVHRCY